jgi:hypothetical protein
MLNSRRFSRTSLALGAFCLLLVALAPAAFAAGPAPVTVRVEGASQTLIPPTEVTTTSTPVVKDGNPAHACAGTSAAGALELATSGNWGGTWFSGLGYSVETIAGETHLFEEGAAANFFWGFWLNNKPATTGVCEAELSAGDSVLLFPECFSETGACPPSPNPLGISAPGVAEAGSPIPVTVTSYANGTGAPSPAAGATVTAGAVSEKTDANGHATLTLTSPGNVVAHVSAPDSVRTEATICIHKGDDGTCGTQGSSGSGGSGATAGAPYVGPFAVVAKAAGVIDNHVYSGAGAPKVLSGTVLAHTAVSSVSIRLRRSYKGRCYAYNGVSTRFLRARCGQGSFFKVSTTASFSYLLPAALKPGRYVLDIEATDAASNHTALARGTSRIVFYVR